MSALGKLIKRNCLVYFRDRSAVFFSLMSMLIVILLMVVFLGDMNVNNVMSILEQYGGPNRDAAADRNNAELLVVLWTIAGIVIVNAVTVTLTMVGIMVQDQEQGKLVSFYVAPVKRFVITLGYIFAAMVVGIIMCIFTMVIAEVYIVGVCGGTLLSFAAAMKVLGIIVLTVFTSASLMFLLAMFVTSESAWGGLGTIVGTLVGFLGGIYLPVGALPDAVGSFMKCFPVLHASGMIREVLCNDMVNTIFAGASDELIATYNQEMGITIELGGQPESALFQVLFLVGYGIISLVVATVLLSKKGVRDR